MAEKRSLRSDDNLYDLTPSEFERLVADLLVRYGYSDLKVVDGPGDRGVDLIGVTDCKPCAIQVKHKTRLRLGEIQQIVNLYFSNPSNPRTFVFVTSARLPQDVSSVGIPPHSQLRLIGRQDVQEMLLRYRDISARYFVRATDRLKSQRRFFWIGALGVACSLAASMISLHSFVFPDKAPLDKRIETVEKALGSIRDLESYLVELKQDMADKEKAAGIINQKYAEAKELEKLTDGQLAALQATLQVQNWVRTVLNYVMGFVLGMASSFLATVLHAKWKQRKALE